MDNQELIFEIEAEAEIAKKTIEKEIKQYVQKLKYINLDGFSVQLPILCGVRPRPFVDQYIDELKKRFIVWEESFWHHINAVVEKTRFFQYSEVKKASEKLLFTIYIMQPPEPILDFDKMKKIVQSATPALFHIPVVAAAQIKRFCEINFQASVAAKEDEISNKVLEYVHERIDRVLEIAEEDL